MNKTLNINVSFNHVIPLQIFKSEESMNGIILGLHGYAQMAESMDAPLKSLAGNSFDYCSLQAPHLFTTPNNSYVSTWMNRKNRDLHVDYQIEYFNNFNDQLCQNAYDKTLKIGFGFSQGASSLYRMVFLSKLKIKLAIIYAGDIPPEIKSLNHSETHEIETKFILVHGDEDNVMTAEKIKEDTNWLKENNFNVELINYSGNHTIDTVALNSVSNHIGKLL
ncbi:MAG: hypothetical protein COA79_10515 [Planctomycetota bacterium]|nr:MAG: hypothetical protein COA79_10515 [Planctomycetota bacterium]